MEKWEYKFVQVSYVEEEKWPTNWKLLNIQEDSGRVSTNLQEVAEELNVLGDEGWEIVDVVPGGPIVPTRLQPDGYPIPASLRGSTKGPRAGGLLILKRRKP